MKKQFAMVQAVLGGIGAVSLFVAAIGIANTMMMSIYERTKEIGVIKVLGCSLRNIKQMFLLEAAFIGFIGGLVGNILSFLISFVINAIVASSGAMGVEEIFPIFRSGWQRHPCDFCSICGDGGRIFPGTSGNAAESIGSNP